MIILFYAAKKATTPKPMMITKYNKITENIINPPHILIKNKKTTDTIKAINNTINITGHDLSISLIAF